MAEEGEGIRGEVIGEVISLDAPLGSSVGSALAGPPGADDDSDFIGATLGDPSKVVTARGTEDGLILRIDGRADWNAILGDIESFLGGRRKFFEGGEVSIEWLERLPTKEQSKELELLLREQYGIEIVTRRKRPPKMSKAMDEGVSKEQKAAERAPERAAERGAAGVTIPLFEEIAESKSTFSSLTSGLSSLISRALPGEDRAGKGAAASSEDPAELGKRYGSRMAKLLGEELFYEDDANAKIVFGTLRSGQRVETPFSLVVIGDVNPGADLAAGGDIIVLGSLRGTAHASAYDDDSFDSVIIALQMQPMQLRIGSVISRGSDEKVRGAEIARIENRRIIVEQFNPRSLFSRRLR